MQAADGGLDEARRQGVVIWHVDVAASGASLLALEAETPRLAASDHRRATVAGGGDPDHPQARERRAVYIALRWALELAFGAGAVRGRDMQRSALGRPSLTGCAGDFSLAHVSGHALVAITGHGSVGIDIECTRPVRMTDRRRAAIERAGAALDAGVPLPQGPDLFFKAWVRLEACAKAHRISMARVLTLAGALGGASPPPEQDILGSLRANSGLSAQASATMIVQDLQPAPGLFGAMVWVGDANTVAGCVRPADFRQLPATLDALKSAVA